MDIRVECSYTEMVRLGDLKPHPQNPNTHSETQIATLADLIASIGWRFPIVVSKRSGYIIAGHCRLAGRRSNLGGLTKDRTTAKDQADAEYLQRKWGKYIRFVNRGSVVGIHIGVPRRQPGVPYARIGGERS